MEDEEFSKLCQQLIEQFKKSIPENETELIELFKSFLEEAIEEFKNIKYPFLKTDDKWVAEQIKTIAENVISKSLEEKKKILLVDKSMQRIVEISNQTYDIASKKLKKDKVDIDFDISERIQELQDLLENVEPYNKKQAKRLISETVADLHFIKHPDTKIYSFRLNDLKKEEEER